MSIVCLLLIYVYFWSSLHFGVTILVQAIIHMILFDSYMNFTKRDADRI